MGQLKADDDMQKLKIFVLQHRIVVQNKILDNTI